MDDGLRMTDGYGWYRHWHWHWHWHCWHTCVEDAQSCGPRPALSRHVACLELKVSYPWDTRIGKSSGHRARLGRRSGDVAGGVGIEWTPTQSMLLDVIPTILGLFILPKEPSKREVSERLALGRPLRPPPSAVLTLSLGAGSSNRQGSSPGPSLRPPRATEKELRVLLA